MSINASTWQAIINDALPIVQDVEGALVVGAALGVPEAGIVEPFVAVLERVLAMAKAAQAGDLSALKAAVQAADAATDLALATKFDPTTGEPR